MMGAPSQVSLKQLRELHIRTVDGPGQREAKPAAAVAPE
jgi:aspartyl-tRNA synthetase